MAKHLSQANNKDEQIRTASGRNPRPWQKYPNFKPVPDEVTGRYPYLKKDTNLRSSKEYLKMWMQDRIEWGMTEMEAIDHSYINYKITMSDKRGFLTAVATTVPKRGKLNWVKHYDYWDIYDTREEAERHMQEDFFHLLGCYAKVRARVVSFAGGFEVDLEGYLYSLPKGKE